MREIMSTSKNEKLAKTFLGNSLFKIDINFDYKSEKGYMQVYWNPACVALYVEAITDVKDE